MDERAANERAADREAPVLEALLRPVGRVVSDRLSPRSVPRPGRTAAVEVFPEYRPALARVAEYSHLWIISWFHLAERDRLRNYPRRVSRDIPEYGVFALRSPSRPNPIALSLTRLRSLDEGRLVLDGLDAVNGTPVLDIKPYNENDSIFSVRTPWLRPEEYEAKRLRLRQQALAHHGEECRWLEVAVDIALKAEDEFGHLQAEDLTLQVRGSACVADVLQGLTRARLANPPRFAYLPDESQLHVSWRRSGHTADWGPVPLADVFLRERPVLLRARATA